MKTSPKVRFVQEVETPERHVAVRKPFRLENQEQRKFVRLQISSPLSLRRIRDLLGNFWPEGEPAPLEGLILNISAGGVLVELDQPLREGDIVCMRFTIQDVEHLECVLGLVKRADVEDRAHLAGIEFISREYLADLLSRAEMDLLSRNMTGFDESVRTLLNKYIHREQRSGQKG